MGQQTRKYGKVHIMRDRFVFGQYCDGRALTHAPPLQAFGDMPTTRRRRKSIRKRDAKQIYACWCLCLHAFISVREDNTYILHATLMDAVSATTANRDLLTSRELRDAPLVSDEYFGLQ